MRDHLTQQELNKEFYGTPPVVNVRFYDREVLDVTMSRAQGREVMKTRLYIVLECKDEKAYADRPASDQDKQRYRGALMIYEKEREDGRLRQIPQAEHEDSDGEPCAYIGSA